MEDPTTLPETPPRRSPPSPLADDTNLLNHRPPPAPQPTPSLKLSDLLPTSCTTVSDASQGQSIRQSLADDPNLFHHSPSLPSSPNPPNLRPPTFTTVSDVFQARSILQAIGDRPDHAAVDAARARLAQIDAALEEILHAPVPDGVDPGQWRAEQAERERECRARAEAERVACKAVVRLDDMHEAYGKVLRDAEGAMVKMEGAKDGIGGWEKGEEEVNEEVVAILLGRSGKCPERVQLSGRHLRFLPEEFGRLSDLLTLDLSNNQLQVCYLYPLLSFSWSLLQ